MVELGLICHRLSYKICSVYCKSFAFCFCFNKKPVESILQCICHFVYLLYELIICVFLSVNQSNVFVILFLVFVLM